MPIKTKFRGKPWDGSWGILFIWSFWKKLLSMNLASLFWKSCNHGNKSNQKGQSASCWMEHFIWLFWRVGKFVYLKIWKFDHFRSKAWLKISFLEYKLLKFGKRGLKKSNLTKAKMKPNILLVSQKKKFNNPKDGYNRTLKQTISNLRPGKRLKSRWMAKYRKNDINLLIKFSTN